MEQAEILRLLFPLPLDTGKKPAKSPKIYIRDTSLLLRLLGIRNAADLIESPAREGIFTGSMIERIMALEQVKIRGTRFYYYGGLGRSQVDLIPAQYYPAGIYEFHPQPKFL